MGTAKTSGPTPSYDKLAAHFQTIAHFEHFSALGDWDQAAMMPMGSGQVRGDAMAELALHIHTLKTSAAVAEHLHKATAESLTTEQAANLREMQYQYQQANMVPGDLVQAKTKIAYQCENAWRDQRKNNDWLGFKPNLKAVIALAKEEAQIRAEAQHIAPYDALLNKFEPGMTTAKLEQTFGGLKDWLPTLIQEVLTKQASEPNLILKGPFSLPAQQALGRDVM
ncbi:MAG: carboxypeptidase M32, partial [Shewanella sp.]